MKTIFQLLPLTSKYHQNVHIALTKLLRYVNLLRKANCKELSYTFRQYKVSSENLQSAASQNVSLKRKTKCFEFYLYPGLRLQPFQSSSSSPGSLCWTRGRVQLDRSWLSYVQQLGRILIGHFEVDDQSLKDSSRHELESTRKRSSATQCWQPAECFTKPSFVL